MTTIPTALIDALPRGVNLDACEIVSYGELRAHHDVSTRYRSDIDDGAVVVVLPGWVADDGNAQIEFPDASDGEEAAREYVDGGDWGDRSETVWIDVWAWRRGFALDEDGDPVELEIDRERHTITLEAEEPECDAADGHDWQSPYEVLGGCRSNPGVFGKGGGVIITEVCAHCGCYRRTDTWATNPDTGEQGLRSLEYLEADDKSRGWIHRSSLESREEN